ncbi:hypothetical protein TELCIR_20944, partial [Teladorsagia circumcincta]
NVSQILSATKQQRLAMEAQQRSGTVAPQPPRIAYACPDCHKTVTSTRNLQSTDDQHYADWSRSNSYSAPQSVSSQHERCLNEPADQLGTLDPNRCESCKKSVSSLRSLKRHHTTCKQYIAENGPPPDSE